jgi:hypothetical protein
MPDCESIAGCPFFNDKMAKMPKSASAFKQNYCKGEFDKCARYMVFKNIGKQAVPSDMFPPMRERAIQIIRAAQRSGTANPNKTAADT